MDLSGRLSRRGTQVCKPGAGTVPTPSAAPGAGAVPGKVSAKKWVVILKNSEPRGERTDVAIRHSGLDLSDESGMSWSPIWQPQVEQK